MTRKNLLHLLWAVPVAAMIAACGSSGGSTTTSASNAGTNMATAPATGSSSASGSASGSASHSPAPVTRVRIGFPPDKSLGKYCLVSRREAAALSGLHAAGLTPVPEGQGACFLTVGDGVGVATQRLSAGLDLTGAVPTAVPQGAPFSRAVKLPVTHHIGRAAALTNGGKWVYISIENPNLSNGQLNAPAVSGIRNIMSYWPSHSHSPAPSASASAPSGSGGVQVPDLAACKVLPASVFKDALGGAAVTSFDGSTARLCKLNTADPGVTAYIADRPVSSQNEANAKSTLVSVGNNVWEEDAGTYITFVSGDEIGVESIGAQANAKAIIAALAALN